MPSTPSIGLNVQNNGSFSVTQSDCIMAQVLAASTVEHVAVPANAKYVVFSGDGDFYARIDQVSNTAIVVPSSDITDGSAGELNPAVRTLPSGSYIHLIASAARVVTMAFYLV